MKINLNQQATVILTQRGADILNAENKKWNDFFATKGIVHGAKEEYQEKDSYKSQLWSLFETFGGNDKMYLGCTTFADCCEIDVEEWPQYTEGKYD